jgi:hypothetical protein
MYMHSVIIAMSGCKVLKIFYYKNDVQAPALAPHSSENFVWSAGRSHIIHAVSIAGNPYIP